MSYKDNIKRKSLMLRDQPLKPIDVAIYWSEFVMRYNGTSHLLNKGMKLYRFQNLLLDVTAFLLLISVTTVIIFLKTCKFIFKPLGFKDCELQVKIKEKRS
ncbi:hypothetical protein NQ318_018608 [Aromia moschata]|uniref:Uncharacterized protein n=1 Tax=Aromia moschata TaxID=1265417 RepID=A0AAV8ZFQ2_9CUCU|nr:hypothetical protein NQ318_018608 [Aromia moschata]